MLPFNGAYMAPVQVSVAACKQTVVVSSGGSAAHGLPVLKEASSLC